MLELALNRTSEFVSQAGQIASIMTTNGRNGLRLCKQAASLYLIDYMIQSGLAPLTPTLV